MVKHSVLKTIDNSLSVYGFTVNESTFLLVCGDKTTSLYNSNYNLIASANERITSVTYNLDLFDFDGTIYSAYGDNATMVDKSAFLPAISTFTDTVAGYYYVINTGEVHVYDSNLKWLSSWVKESSQYTASTFVLANGNVLIQQTRQLPNDAKKFTYYNGSKYELTSYVMNPKNGKLTSVNLDFKVIEAAYNDEEFSSFNDKIKNVAVIYPIENQVLLNGDYSYKLVALNNNGTIKGYILDNLPGFGAGDFTWFTNERFAYLGVSSQVYITDKSGKLVATFNDWGAYNNVGFITDGTIYDWSFNSGYNYKDDEMTLVATLNNSYILEKDNLYYRYSQNGKTLIGRAENVTINNYDDYYVVKDGLSYGVYNSTGNKLTTLESIPSVIARYDGNYVLQVTTNNATKYVVIY
jgi:hypothetical protein